VQGPQTLDAAKIGDIIDGFIEYHSDATVLFIIANKIPADWTVFGLATPHYALLSTRFSTPCLVCP
jgi:hypothetical protein